jgi:hypothetical protein
MIKIYRLKQALNNGHHVLVGAGGNKVHYEFTGGNVIAGTCPELSLKGKYFQDLLESSKLFKSGTVVLVREIETSDDIDPVPAPEPTPKKQVDSVDSVTTPDELLVYVNTNYSKNFTSPAKALAFAAKEGIVFPKLSLGE